MLEVIYGQLGMIQAAAAFFTYFVVMAENGFWPSSILFRRNFWEDHGNFVDSYGQEWVRRKPTIKLGRTKSSVSHIYVR